MGHGPGPVCGPARVACAVWPKGPAGSASRAGRPFGHWRVGPHYVAKLWRRQGLKPHRQGTFKLSRDPAFAAKVADVVVPYLDPPGGAMVLCIDEKTQVQVQALDQ
jgi:hypothetical protein